MVKMIRALVFSAACLAGLTAAAAAGPAAAQEPQAFDMRGAISEVLTALDRVATAMPGMGGAGVIPEPDLSALNGMIGESEKLLRKAQVYARDSETVIDQAWAVAYARAALSIALAAYELGAELGHWTN
jgi:hypothetical protein